MLRVINLSRPAGTLTLSEAKPTLKRRPILNCPSGTKAGTKTRRQSIVGPIPALYRCRALRNRELGRISKAPGRHQSESGQTSAIHGLPSRRDGMRVARRFSAWKNRVCLSPNRTAECFECPTSAPIFTACSAPRSAGRSSRPRCASDFGRFSVASRGRIA